MKTVLGIVREWIQWNALNGSAVKWNSDDVLQFNKSLTVRDFEQLAAEIDVKFTASNSEYEAALRVFEEFSKSDDNDFRVTSFYMWINKHLSSRL